MVIEQTADEQEKPMSETEQTELQEQEAEEVVEPDDEVQEEPEPEEDDEFEAATKPVAEQTDVQAVIEGSVNQIEKMLTETAVGYHDNPYVNISDGRIRFIAGSPGNVVVVYSDYVEGSVDSIEGDTEAVIKVSDILDTLSLIGDRNSEVRLEFEGVEGSRLAQRLRIEGQLEAGILLPGSESVLSRVPLELPDMFTEEDRLINANSGEPAGTHIETFINSLEKIVDVSEVRGDLSNFPVVVENGEFRMDVGDRNQNYIAGALPGTVVEGEDLANNYGEGLKKIANQLSGEVDIYVEQNSPICVVKQRSHGTLRHVVGPAES